MDFADLGSEAEELFRRQALEIHAALARATRGPTGKSAQWCQNADCGVEIPEARRLYVPGVQLCVDCQKLKERGVNK